MTPTPDSSASPLRPNAARDLSDALASTVEKAGAYILGIDARRWPTSGLAWSADGVFLAANHAIERDEDLGVRLPDGSEHPAKLIGRDPSLGLAVLRTEAVLTPASWVPATQVRAGQLVLGLYRPQAQVRARLGVIEGVGEGFHTPWGGKVDASIDVDASTRNLSAVTWVEVEGRVVGFHVSGGRGHGLTLPHSTLERVVGQLLQHGRVRRGYLGIGSQPARLPEAARAAAGAHSGLLVTAVEPRSPADLAGLVLGDVLVGIEGKPVEDVGDLWRALQEDAVGHAVQVQLLRAGKVTQVSVTVGERP